MSAGAAFTTSPARSALWDTLLQRLKASPHRPEANPALTIVPCHHIGAEQIGLCYKLHWLML